MCGGRWLRKDARSFTVNSPMEPECPEEEGIGSLDEPGTAGSWSGLEVVVVSFELEGPRGEAGVVPRGGSLGGSPEHWEERGELREVSEEPSAGGVGWRGEERPRGHRSLGSVLEVDEGDRWGKGGEIITFILFIDHRRTFQSCHSHLTLIL